METKEKQPITGFYKTWKTREEVRLLIPMGYIPGMPVITVKNDQLVAMIPFLRYKVTGTVDRTLVYPVRYVLEYLVPEMQLAAFRDLSIEPAYEKWDFGKVAGFFRHEAIRHLDKAEFAKLRGETIALYDRMIDFLTSDEADFTPADEARLKANLQTIVEPFIQNQYDTLDRDFYNKYLNK